MSGVSTITRRLTNKLERLLCFFVSWQLIPVILVSFYQFSWYFYLVSCPQVLDFYLHHLEKISENKTENKTVQNFNVRNLLQVIYLIQFLSRLSYVEVLKQLFLPIYLCVLSCFVWSIDTENGVSFSSRLTCVEHTFLDAF